LRARISRHLSISLVLWWGGEFAAVCDAKQSGYFTPENSLDLSCSLSQLQHGWITRQLQVVQLMFTPLAVLASPASEARSSGACFVRQ